MKEFGYEVSNDYEKLWELIKSGSKWTDAEIHKLLRIGVMRILGLKRKILKNKFKGE